jgi:P4 family phage/plasmid primase-like protien
MPLSKELYSLMKENYVYDLFYTHVSLIQPKGKYSLSSRLVMDKFWTLYSKIVLQEPETMLGLAEIPQNHTAVLVDVDLKFNLSYHPETRRLYTLEFVEHMIHIYQDVLREVVKDVKDEELLCVLLEKPMYQSSDNYYHWKNGFHLHFPNLFISRVDQEVIIIPRVRQLMSENRYDILNEFNLFSEELVNVERITQLIDTASTRNAWLLYGSRKTEEQNPYTISQVYNHELQKVDWMDTLKNCIIFDSEDEPIELNESNIEFHLPRILSICPNNRPVKETDSKIYQTPFLTQYIQRAKPQIDIQDEREDDQVERDIQTARQIIPFLSVDRADNYMDWMTVGWALYNISKGSDDGMDIWIEFSRQSSKFNEAKCIYEWAHMEDRKKITLGTLKYFAKTDSPIKYQQYITENTQKYIEIDMQSSHYDLAKLLHEQYENEFVYTDSGWYRYTNHHWEFVDAGMELRSKISTDLVELYAKFRQNMFAEIALQAQQTTKSKQLEEQQKQIFRIMCSLKTTPFKNNIMKECQEVFYVREFERKLNSNPYLIGFQNGVYDLEANIFRSGLPTDLISTQMSIKYVDFTDSDPRVQDVNSFLEKVFPDNSLRRYFLDIMSETFVGYNHRKQVYFWTGEGDNGKSITQMFFEKMFGKLSIKAPTSMITSRRPNAGSANAELARAGNGVRTIFLEEPDPDEEIFTGVFKHLSGNDSIYTRDLFQKGKDVSEIVPMFKLFVICNKLPKIRKGGDKATWNRIRVIPFESTFSKTAPSTSEEQIQNKTFPMDPNLAQKIPTLVEPFAWMLLKHRMKPKIAEPEKVHTATDRYRMNNDYLHQFSSQTVTEDSESTVLPSDLYYKYKEWLEEGMPGVQRPPLMEFIEYFQKKWGDLNEDGVWKGWRIKHERGKNMENNESINQLL